MDATAKKGNLNLVLCAIIAVMAILLWFTNCSGKKETTEVTIPEVKGSFKTVTAKDIEVKYIPAPAVGQKVSKQELSKIDNFKKLYNLTQKQYDSLVVVNRTLDSLANSLYDKRLQPVLDACKFIEFKHEFDNDTIHITLTGITRGAPQNLNTSYVIKARKQEVKVPVTVFRLLGGVETGMKKDLTRFNAKVNIGLQNKKGNILTISADTDQRFYIGYSASIFSIKR
jgi:hypothetical protein